MASIFIQDKPEIGSLDYGMWPDRKRPMLTISHGNESEVIAYFRDEKAKETFNTWMLELFSSLGVDVASDE